MSPKTKSHLTLAVKIAVALVLITFLVRSGHLDPRDLWDLLTVRNVIVALILVGGNILLAAWRWIILLRARGLELSLSYGLSLYLIGIFFNHALPGSVGGDVVRGYYLVSDHPDRRLDSILSIVIDRILGLYSFFILTLLAVAFDFEFVTGHEKIRWVALAATLVFAGMTTFFVIAFSERLSRAFGIPYLEKLLPPVHRLMEAFQKFGRDRQIIALSVFVSLLAQVFTMVFFYQLGVVSGETDISWKAVLFAVPMGFLVTAIPIAPAGIGVGQVAFLYLFQAYLEKTTQFGATAVTAYQLCVVFWALVGAVFYLKRRKPTDDLENIEEAAAKMAST